MAGFERHMDIGSYSSEAKQFFYSSPNPTNLAVKQSLQDIFDSLEYLVKTELKTITDMEPDDPTVF